jgi:hypothetical protein
VLDLVTRDKLVLASGVATVGAMAGKVLTLQSRAGLDFEIRFAAQALPPDEPVVIGPQLDGDGLPQLTDVPKRKPHPPSSI